jgi:hypothetical protein
MLPECPLTSEFDGFGGDDAEFGGGENPTLQLIQFVESHTDEGEIREMSIDRKGVSSMSSSVDRTTPTDRARSPTAPFVRECDPPALGLL